MRNCLLLKEEEEENYYLTFIQKANDGLNETIGIWWSKRKKLVCCSCAALLLCHVLRSELLFTSLPFEREKENFPPRNLDFSAEGCKIG